MNSIIFVLISILLTSTKSHSLPPANELLQEPVTQPQQMQPMQQMMPQQLQPIQPIMPPPTQEPIEEDGRICWGLGQQCQQSPDCCQPFICDLGPANNRSSTGRCVPCFLDSRPCEQSDECCSGECANYECQAPLFVRQNMGVFRQLAAEFPQPHLMFMTPPGHDDDADV